LTSFECPRINHDWYKPINCFYIRVLLMIMTFDVLYCSLNI